MTTDRGTPERKLRGMCPEVGAHGLDFRLCFDDDEYTWIVQREKGKHELRTHLERRNTEALIEGA